MRFKEDASVYTADQQEVGQIERVVIDPRTAEVTHLVVRQGIFLPEDKVISIDFVAEASEDRVVLRQEAGDLDRLPPFEEETFIDVDRGDLDRTGYMEYPAPVYWYPAYGTMGMGYGGYLGPLTEVEIERNIPDDTVALKEGAKVVSADGEHVGDVEQVLADSSDGHITHFVITQGLLFKERKVVPLNWVRSISEDGIYLGVGTGTLERLPEYRE